MFDTVNWIYFDINNYKDDYIDDGTARMLMWEDIMDQIKTLMKNNFIAVIKDLDKDLIAIEFNPNNQFIKSDAVNPYWMRQVEYDEYISSKEEVEDFYRKLP